MSEELPTVPPAQNDRPTTEKKRKESSLLLLWWMRMLLFFRTWMGWLTIGFLATFVVVSTAVPVGRIPFLRNIVYAMGYSGEEAMNLSFFKAFLGWNEHAKIARGELPDPNAILVFGKDGGFLDAANRKGAGASSLINFKQLNAAQARTAGRLGRANIIAGVADSIPGRDNKNKKGVALNGKDVSAQTQANQAGISDVFFGDDAGMIVRNPKDAYNSTQNLKSLASAKGIVAGTGTNTLGFLIDRAVRVDSDIDSILHAIDNRGSFGTIGGIARLGSNNPGREDLYYAWLLSRAAQRARQASLQKKLASMAYMGGELPRSVFVMGGNGGLGFNPDDFEADMERMQDYLKQDEECENAIERSNTPAFQADMNQMTGHIKELVLHFPQTCGEVINSGISGFNEHVSRVQDTCRKMGEAYRNISDKCGVVAASDAGQCKTPEWTTQVASFNGYCQDLFQQFDRIIASLEDEINELTATIGTLTTKIENLNQQLTDLNTQLGACADDACRADVQGKIDAKNKDLDTAEKDKKAAEAEKARTEKDKKQEEEDKEKAKSNDWSDSHEAGKTDLSSNKEVENTIQYTYYDAGFDVTTAGEGERGHLRNGYFPSISGWGNQERDY